MTIIFSDTHLTPAFDPTLFNKLKRVISKANRVIINGDFWDGYLTNFDTFINSEWKKLFRVLKKKNTIYIFGNHDPKDFADKRYRLFSDKQLDFFRFKSGDQHYHVEHGDRLDLNLTVRSTSLLPFLRASYIFIERHRKKRTFLGHFFEYVSNLLDQKGDALIKKFMEERKDRAKFFYIFGHTHIPFFSRKLCYANSGRFGSEESRYIEITSSKCSLKQIR